MSRPPATARTIWRLALLWHGTALDVVTLKRSGTLHLRTGETLRVRARGDQLDIAGVGLVDAGEVVELPAGHTLVATRDLPEARVGTLSALDSTLFHAVMIGAAVQACVVSALVLAPAPSFDNEAGAGMPGEWRRYLVSPGGTAPHVGAPLLNVAGRKPDEVEKVEPVRAAGQTARSPAGKRMTLDESLAEMARVLHLGNDGAQLREAVGAIAIANARAPVAGADLGGLAPKDPMESGQGNGLIGAGESKLNEVLHRRIDDNDKKAQTVLKNTKPEARPPIPVQTIEMSQAEFDAQGMEPAAKEALRQAIKRRDNAVKSCYESRGLARDPTRAGRLKVELTLLPSGRVMDPVVTADDHKLDAVAACVAKLVGEWYLGDGLVDEPKRLALPFNLVPAKDVQSIDFDAAP